MKLTITNDDIVDKTNFIAGSHGYFDTEVNPLIIIGEDDTHVWTILDRNGMYVGISKNPENLAAVHITSVPDITGSGVINANVS